MTFGAQRLSLALVVVIGHVWGPGWIGTYAVFGFFILSGYLMCRVMNKRYRFPLRGITAFAGNSTETRQLPLCSRQDVLSAAKAGSRSAASIAT